MVIRFASEKRFLDPKQKIVVLLYVYRSLFIEGYLRLKKLLQKIEFFRYNVIIFKNKKFLISSKSQVSFLRYYIFCIFFNHSIIFESYNVMFSFITSGRKHFWIYQLNHKAITQAIESNIFSKNLGCFGGLGSKSRPFLIYQPNAITEKPIMIWF